ncbi:MAG TPA: hypothetical protein VFE62_10885 [Gemmataceae bacterium]|nr:hypothetical protein [Gemmataceae bacterium]
MRKYRVCLLLVPVLLIALFCLREAYVGLVSPTFHAIYYEALLGDDERSVSILVEALADRREVVRSVVVSQLAKRDCLDQLMERGLSNSNAATREGAASVLVLMSPWVVVPKDKEQELRTELRRNMQDADPLVRVQSARACWAIFRDKSVLDVYIDTFGQLDLTGAKDRRTCYQLFNGIWEMRSDGRPATDFLQEQTKSGDRVVQSWAQSALKGIEDPKVEFFGD